MTGHVKKPNIECGPHSTIMAFKKQADMPIVGSVNRNLLCISSGFVCLSLLLRNGKEKLDDHGFDYTEHSITDISLNLRVYKRILQKFSPCMDGRIHQWNETYRYVYAHISNLCMKGGSSMCSYV